MTTTNNPDLDPTDPYGVRCMLATGFAFYWEHRLTGDNTKRLSAARLRRKRAPPMVHAGRMGQSHQHGAREREPRRHHGCDAPPHWTCSTTTGNPTWRGRTSPSCASPTAPTVTRWNMSRNPNGSTG